MNPNEAIGGITLLASLWHGMHSNTPEEQEAYNRMRAKMSTKLVTESELLELKAENDKLRELVRDLYLCSDTCNDCPQYNGSGDGFYCSLGVGWKARRMRELGIEV